MTNHAHHQEDIGAYLLGALPDADRVAFERHLAACRECQEEVERLRPAADALPGSVQQFEPPPRLKKALMDEVTRDAAPAGPERRRPRLRFMMRPAFVAATLLVGLAIGFGVAQLGGDDTRTLTATVAMSGAGGELEVADDNATLRLQNMPQLRAGQVYQAWIQQGERMVPARTFEVGGDGSGEVRLPDVGDANGVYVTREAQGGAQVPSEDPIVSVML
jgi:anti-sigma factor RsiW